MINKGCQEILCKEAAKFQVQLAPKHVELFNTYLVELKKWNSKTNITAIHDDQEIVIKHFIDSLSPSKYIPPYSSILDIGSGGGFPGIPLKIADPSLEVTLLDSTLKKIHFQKHIIRLLQLDRVTPIHARAEDRELYNKLNSSFDVVISRAFSDLGKLMTIGIPYIRDSGVLIAMRGRDAKNELASIKYKLIPLGLKVFEPGEFSLPYSHEKRSLILFSKSFSRDPLP